MVVRNLSHQTMRIIEQNHFLALSTDLVGTLLAMMGMLHPVLAGMVHILHTGGIVLNSGRLLNWEAPKDTQRPQGQMDGKTVQSEAGKKRAGGAAQDSTGEDRLEAVYGRKHS